MFVCRVSIKYKEQLQSSVPSLKDTLTLRKEKDLNEQFDVNLIVG